MIEPTELPLAPPLGLSIDPARASSRMPSKFDEVIKDDQMYLRETTHEDKGTKSRKKSKGLDQSRHSTKSSKSKKKVKKKKKIIDELHNSLPNLDLESSTPTNTKNLVGRSTRRASIGNCSRNSALDSSFFQSSTTDRSDWTADTEPSTPSTLKMTVDLSRQMPGLEANIETIPVNFPAITEEPAISKQESKAEKEIRREKESKKSKEKKKSKKGKKKKKEKGKEKKVKKKGKMGSLRSLGSFGSSRSFGSQRSLGSYVNERGEAGEGFVFLSGKPDAHPLGSGGSRRGTRKRVIPKGSRTVPLVSMPESAVSPDLTRKKFNDNNNKSTHSFTSFDTSFRKSPTFLPASPALTSPPLTQYLTNQVSTPTSTTASVSSKGSIKMIPKSRSFSFQKALCSPTVRSVQSDPTSMDISNKETNYTSEDEYESSPKNLPMTKYCSAPKATHPNKAVGKAWKSPFDNEVKYLESELDLAEEHFEALKGANVESSPTKSDESSQHSQIDDLWDYGPSALIQKNKFNGNISKSSVVNGNNSKSSVSYDNDDDLSALTMSLRTERTGEISPRRARACSRGYTIVEKGAESPCTGDNARSRSPTPPRSTRDERGIDEALLKRSHSLDETLLKRNYSLDTCSGEEGSISLHDSAVRSSSPVDKSKLANRQERVPTVPRFHTPPRIRFGEGQSDPNSPRSRDKVPCLPQRQTSEHNRGDVDEEEDSEIPVMPIVEEEADSDSRDLEDRTSKVVDDFNDDDVDDDNSVETPTNSVETQTNSDETPSNSVDTPTDNNEKPTSLGSIDDADAAAGTSPKTETSKFDSTPKSPGRVNHLIKNYEAMEGATIPIQSPSFYKRKPKNLKPIPPEARDVPATMMLLRTPSLPSPTSPVRVTSPTRNASGPLLPRLSKKDDVDIEPSYCIPAARKSPAVFKMTVKPMPPSPFDSSDHSSAKEAMQGTSSDWAGSPKKVILDASYNQSESDTEEPTKATNAVKSPAKRRKSTGKNETKSERRKSKNEAKSERRSSIGSKGEGKSERRSSVGSKNEGKSKRKSSIGSKSEGKSERRRSISSKNEAKSERRRSISSKNEAKSERRSSIGKKEATSERRTPIGKNEADLIPSRDNTKVIPERRYQASPRRRSRTPDSVIRGNGGLRSPGNTKPSSYSKRDASDKSSSSGTLKKRCACDTCNRSMSPGCTRPRSLTNRGDRSRSPGNTRPSSLTKRGDRSRSPGNTRPRSLTNRGDRSRSPGNTRPSSLTNRGDRSRSPGNIRPSSLTMRGNGDRSRSPGKHKPSSYSKKKQPGKLPVSPIKHKPFNTSVSPRKHKPINPISPRKHKPRSFKKKQPVNNVISPRKNKIVSPRKIKQPMTVDGATGTPVGVSPQPSTALERVKKLGKGLLGLTPGSTHSKRGKATNYPSKRLPDPPLTANANRGGIPTTISAPPLSPPPKNGLFSKNRLKDRAYLSGNRGGWGGEKAKLQKKREKESKKSAT